MTASLHIPATAQSARVPESNAHKTPARCAPIEEAARFRASAQKTAPLEVKPKGPPRTRLLYQVFALLAHVVRSPPVAVALVQACESSHLPDSRQIPAYAGERIRCGTTPSIKAVGSSGHEIRLARFRAQVCR